jgi:amidohydrolase
MNKYVKNTSLTEEDFKEMVETRRYLHQHPEFGYEEHETAKFVAHRLRKLGYTVKEGVGKTGVVGLLKEKTEGKVLLIRADMDALPLQELNDVEYKSQNDGYMHACGHDAHVAILLTVAKKLVDMRGVIPGQIKLIFQPAEEGLNGAEAMVADGVMEDPAVDNAVGLHIFTNFEVGLVAATSGSVMAAVDEFHLKIKGKGGHGASPHEANDPIVISSNIINASQTIVSRSVEPVQPVTLTFGTFHSGTSFNIIPEEAVLSGTVRTFTQDVHDLVKRRFEELVSGICSSFGAKYELDYEQTNIATVNDAWMTGLVRDCAEEVVGRDKLIDYVTTGGEDMSIYLREVPGCFFFVGGRNASKGITSPHHSPYFDIDEDSMLIGGEMFLRIVRKYFGIFG